MSGLFNADGTEAPEVIAETLGALRWRRAR